MSEQLTLSAELVDGGIELLSIEADVKAGRCTAARALARQELRQAALDLLAEGVLGTRRIAQLLGISRETVRALRATALASGELDHAKQALGRSMIGLAHAARDRIMDELDEMPRQSLPIIMGIAIDKGQLLTGGATARVERTQGLTAEQINALIDQLPVEVVALPVEPEGGAAEKAPALEAGDLSAVGVVDHAPDSGASHPESPAFQALSKVHSTSRADSGPESAEKGEAA